jgi:hypothetical protein
MISVHHYAFYMDYLAQPNYELYLDIQIFWAMTEMQLK